MIDREYNYLSFVFRKGKHIRFITEFPKDLRKACLGKNSYYFDKPKDTPSKRRAKLLVRRVLANDSLINEYLTGNYFTYEGEDTDYSYISPAELFSIHDAQTDETVLIKYDDLENIVPDSWKRIDDKQYEVVPLDEYEFMSFMRAARNYAIVL